MQEAEKDFQNLPGTGKPLPGPGDSSGENW